MCGIVGYIGEKEAGPILLGGLRRLEYRGYDSAGLGVVAGPRLEVRRSAGKIAALERLLASEPVAGHLGVAHTRWATHGRPCAANAHPHRDCPGSLAVVHNGIIENYRPLRADLESRGHRFSSDTDTEVIAHLIESESEHDMAAAARNAVQKLRGAYALGIISRNTPEKLIAVRNGGPPLVVGRMPHGSLLASDVAALLEHTREVVILDNGEMAVLSRQGARFVGMDGREVHKSPVQVPWDSAAAEKAGYPHFMLKEIFEQPRAIEDTYRERIDVDAGEVVLPEIGLSARELAKVRRVRMLACGTSYHSALAGRHMIESLAGLPVEVDIASEFRYRPPIAEDATLTVAISQSGETADTLGALRDARGRGTRTLAVCNVLGSTLARESDGIIYTRAGPEIGVASTKAFTSQLVALYLLAVHLGRARCALAGSQAAALLRELTAIPPLADSLLARNDELLALAQRFRAAANFLYLGRGIHYPLALEGALKLKEISYVHAEAHAAGEIKHGPIALVDPAMSVVVIAPLGRLHEKDLATIEEVKARDGTVLAFVSEGDEVIRTQADAAFSLPRTSELLLSILAAVPLQLLAYHHAVLRGCDVDQPRNLAKSVTVE
jgi:glucosamine--fructose-6-phosphate aminotransferase (isomerizing)